MALNIKEGERVTLNAGYLRCGYCPCKMPGCDMGLSASSTVNMEAGTNTYTGHHDGCPGIGKPVPAGITVERRIMVGTVTKAPAGSSRNVWVKWDDAKGDHASDIFDLHRVESIIDKIAKIE